MVFLGAYHGIDPGMGWLFAVASHHYPHMVSAHSTAAAVGVMAVVVHTLGYLSVMTLAAWVVYRKLGLRLLRSAWINMDWVWAVALVVTGIVVISR